MPEEPPRFPVTLESRFTDLNQSFIGRILFNAVLSIAKKQIKEAERMGFKKVVIPKQCLSGIDVKNYDIEIIPASTLKQAFAAIK